MIFEIDEQIIAKLSGSELSDVICCIMKNNHYVLCTPKVHQYIEDAIVEHASTTYKSIFYESSMFTPTTQLKQFLPTLDLSGFSKKQISVLVDSPSLLLVENEVNEWPVYCEMIRRYAKYQRDPFHNIFMLLNRATDRTLKARNGGGYGQCIQIIEFLNAREYEGVLKYKICVLFDRDTDDNHTFDSNKNALFQFLCHKEAKQMKDEDVYSLQQASEYTWHMWYKRAIENYFLDEVYESNGVDVSELKNSLNRDYYKICEENIPTYHKDLLPKLVSGMSREKFEQNLQVFATSVGDISELRLFLLKLVRIL